MKEIAKLLAALIVKLLDQLDDQYISDEALKRLREARKEIERGP